MTDNDADVIVLGAGAAGLMAARELSKRRRVIVLEARDRVGGRLHTIYPTGHPIPVELGPEFIHGTAPETFALLEEAGLVAYDIVDRHFDGTRRPLRERPEEWERVEAFMQKLGRVKAEDDVSFDTFLRQHGSHLPPKIRALAASFVEGFNAARKEEISAASLSDAAEEEERIGQTQYRLIGGYDRLALALARSIAAPSRVDSMTQVTRVAWGRRGTVVHARRADGEVIYRARRCVVALPLGVLQTSGGGPVFEPALPVQQVLDEQLRMGAVTKLMLRFKTAWWESEAERGLAFVHGGSGLAFPTWWTTLPLRTRQLTGWAGGPAAERLPRGVDALLPLGLASLSAIFGRPVDVLSAALEAAYASDWQADPLARGAYSYAATGGAAAPDVLARAGDGVLFFAGEHTHRGLMGTVAGALGSGERAARAVLDRPR